MSFLTQCFTNSDFGMVYKWGERKGNSDSPYLSDSNKHAVRATKNSTLKLKLIYKIALTDKEISHFVAKCTLLKIYQVLVSVSIANKDPVYFYSLQVLIIVGEFVHVVNDKYCKNMRAGIQ